MSKLDRRRFLAGASAVPLTLWLQGCPPGNGKPDGNGQGPGNGDPGNGDTGNGNGGNGGLVRYEARSSEGQAMLDIYRQAVGIMMDNTAIPEGDPTSWIFQWYIHGVRGDTTKAAEIARIYPGPSPERDLAEEIWNTCQAHYPGDDENFFLPWHRMFVYYFESIIREVSGHPEFTLPYWNYTVDASIPPEFRVVGSPLYIEKRNPGVNDGVPIDDGQPGDPLSLISLEECEYEPNGPNQGFNMALDFGIHGNVHVLTGNNLNMGSVPWAAGDPIFWMHHCNIDRLWASWNAGGRQNPTTAHWLDQVFVFANAQGQRVEATVSDFTSIAPLGYSYDHLEPVPACPETEGMAGPESMATLETLALSGSAVELGSAPIQVRLASAPGVETVGSVLEAADDQKLYVVVKDLAAQTQPGVIYNLYLGLPEGAAAPEGDDSRLLGSLNFFGFAHGDHQGDHGAGTAGADAPEKFVSYEITELARELRAAGVEGEPRLTIAPAGDAAADAKPVLGEVSLVRR